MKKIVLLFCIVSFFFLSCDLFFVDIAAHLRESMSEMNGENSSSNVQTLYYVSENGNDDETGISAAYPLKTVQKALELIAASEAQNENYSIIIDGTITTAEIDIEKENERNITISGTENISNSVTTLTISGSGAHVTLGNELKVEELIVSDNAQITLDGATVSTIHYSTLDVEVFAKSIQSPLTIKEINSTHATLLVKNSGANFGESDFVFAGSVGSLYLDGGHLYYSTYKIPQWNAITLTAIAAAPAVAGLHELHIDENYEITSKNKNVTFDASDYSDTKKTDAITNAVSQMFAPHTFENIQSITASDITVSLPASFIDITLRTKNEYVFDQQTLETEKVLRLDIQGDFNSYERIEWGDVAMTMPSPTSLISFRGKWILTDGAFGGSVADSSVAVRTGYTDKDINDAIVSALTVPNATVSSTFTSDDSSVTTTITLNADTGYVFADGTTSKTIPITVALIFEYSLSFDINGGDSPSSLPSKQVLSKGAQFDRPFLTTYPTKPGYTFVDWALDTAGNTRVTFPYAVNKDTTFYAIWTAGTLTYSDNGSGSLIIDRGVANGENEIIVPSNINGTPVISIADNAFANTAVESIIIEDGVTSIGSSAFSTCRNLINITLPSTLSAIGNSTFSDCSALRSINIPDGITSIGSEAFSYCTGLENITLPSALNSIGDYAFSGCAKITSIDIPSTVSSIDPSAFVNCSSLSEFIVDGSNTHYESISGVLFSNNNLVRYPSARSGDSYDIPDTITNISNYAFEGSINLKTINIPKAVISIGTSVFNGCAVLENFTISLENTAFAQINGVLYSKDKTALIKYPSAKLEENFCVNSAVTSIADNAFEDCSNLTSVTISSAVTAVGNYAFYGASNATLYSAIASRPVNWNDNFNPSGRPVVWGIKANTVGEYPYVVSITKTDTTIENASDTNTLNAPYRQGFTFKGWTTTEGKTTADSGLESADSLRTAVANGTTVYAAWVPAGTGP